MVFVYLPDGGFRLDLLTWWGASDAEWLAEHPGEVVTYGMLIGGVLHDVGTTATIEQFTEAVRNAQAVALIGGRPFLGAKG